MNKYLLILLSLFIFSCNKPEKKTQTLVEGYLPVPTEFSIEKSKRRDFKNARKDYIENMHRAHPDHDWKKIDQKTRSDRIAKVQNIRRDLFSKNMWIDNNYTEFISRNLTGVWYEKGSNNLSGRIRTADIDWDNDLIYCASSGGNIWRGTLNGENWTSLNDFMQITGIIMLRLINDGNLNRMLIASGKNFNYTDNEAVTIETATGLDFLSNWGSIKRSVIKEENGYIYLLANEWDYDVWHEVGTIYKSINNGESFNKILTLNTSEGFNDILGSSHFDIWTSRYFDGEIYLLNNNDLYIINNLDQLTYIGELPTELTGENLLTGGTDTNNKFLYAHVGNHIFFSIDGGNSWVDKGERPQWWFTVNSFSSSNINFREIYYGGMEVFRSNNSANSWTLVSNWWEYYGNEYDRLHADIPEIRFFLDPEFNEIALISTDGGIYLSDDKIQTVQNLSMEGLGVSQYYSSYTKRTEPYHIYVGSQDQGFQRSLYPSEGILDFEQSISGDYGHLVSGDQGETIWSNYPGFTMYYPDPEVDGGGYMLDFPGSGHLWLAPLMEDPYISNGVYLGGGGLDGGNHLFHLTMENHSLSYEQEPYSFNGRVSAMSYSPINLDYRYVLTDNGSFYYSSNNGQNWQISNGFDGPDAHYFYGSTIWASKTTFGKVIIGGSGYSNPAIYVSYNHGQSFERMDEGLPNTLVFQIVGNSDDSYYFAATEVGPYVYLPDEGIWSDMMGISAPDQTYWNVDYIDQINTVRFVTYGRGIWDFVIDYINIIDGDANLDQIVNVQDIVLVVNFILGISSPDENQFDASDINNDGILNVMDVVGIINIILNE